jgi:hypothetical protein
MGKSSETKSQPVYSGAQSNAQSALLNAAMGHLGIGGTQATGGGGGAYSGPGGGIMNKLFGNYGGIMNKLFGNYGGRLGAITGTSGTNYGTPSTTDIFSQLAQPYTGQFTAPISSGEQYATDWMRKALEGNYDPRTSDYYQGMRTQIYDDLDKAKTGVRQSAALGGMLASTPRIGQEATLERKALNDVSTLLGGMYETERNRLQQLAPQYMTAAGVERGIQQAELDKQYQEFIRQITALGIPLDTALKLINWSPGSTSTTSGGSDMSGLGAIAAALIGAA